VSNYIVFPIDTEPPDLQTLVYDYLKSRIPGWEPSSGNLDVWLTEAFSEVAADIRTLASDVPTSIFRYFGATVVGLQPTDAASAQAATTWTMKDNAGYTIPAGSLVGIRDASGEVQTFQTFSDYIVPPGTTSTPTGDVPVIAVVAGEAATGLGSAGVAMELQSPLEFVTGVTIAGASSGGVDAESDEDYLNRLSTWMTLVTPTPILPHDFAIMARQIPGVYRTTAIDGFIPPSSTNQEKAVAVVGIDAQGNALSAGVKSDIETYLESLREVNFVVSAIDPSFKAVDVQVTVHARPGYSNVDTDVEAALQNYLSPLQFSMPQDGSPRDWDLEDTVRYLELTTLVNNVSGVDYIVSLTMRIDANAYDDIDITLPGVAPLPTPGSITCTLA
jgi:uncharacterized phage protein gp47/JayE